MTDARLMAGFVQGALVMTAHRFAQAMLAPPVKIEQPVDDEGIFAPYFLVHLASGGILRVSVLVEREVPNGR